MHRCFAFAVALLIAAAPAQAQEQVLRDLINELFIFSESGGQLFLSGTADPDNPASVQAHGDHFIPSAVASNNTLIQFLTNAVGTSIANIPISATSSGRTFRFEGAVPIATSSAPGPIFAERAPTIGQGRLFAGGTVNIVNFKTLRGVRLDQLALTFAHQNTDAPGCDQIQGDDCSKFGVPVLENDVINLDLDIDLNVVATIFLFTYGVTDRVDIGVALPIISTKLAGQSQATVVPFGSTVNHFFGGTLANPQLTASRTIDGSATGLGDIAARVKVSLTDNFSILGDARLPTGSEEDLLGSGETTVRAVAIASRPFGDFTPHVNLGYLFRSTERGNDAFLATVGFDQVLAPWAAVAVEFLSQFQIGDNTLTVPEPATLDAPFRRRFPLSNLPNLRDDILSGAVGFKFVTPSGVTLVAHSLWPLNDGGLRANIAWTFGLEYSF